MIHIGPREAAQLRTTGDLSSPASSPPTKTKTVHHFDVRQQSELQEDGWIPGATLVPLGELSRYHLPPTVQDAQDTTALLFSCRAGGRSAKAAQLAVDWGYKNGPVFLFYSLLDVLLDILLVKIPWNAPRRFTRFHFFTLGYPFFHC